MKNEIRVEKRCQRCGHRMFDKIGFASGYVEIWCPECRSIVRINQALRHPRTCGATGAPRRGAAPLKVS